MGRVTNEDLLREIAQSKADGKPTETLGKMIIWIANHQIKKRQFTILTYTGELEEAMIRAMLNSYTSFKSETSDNPFAFLMQTSTCAMVNYIAKEKRKEENKNNE